MLADDLFELLDLDADGQVSRADLRGAAARLGWHWHQAPLYAVLDRLTVQSPLSKAALGAIVDDIAGDRRGPYGVVLHRCGEMTDSRRADGGREPRLTPAFDSRASGDLVQLLKRVAGDEAAGDYQQLLSEVIPATVALSPTDAALLIIDPQRAFTSGSWMRSLGSRREREVQAIRLAFDNCGALLRRQYRCTQTVFTRCPFPPDSYEWDERVAEHIDAQQSYFVKPGNSVLWPPTNGFADWAGALVDSGRNTLVMGGCTLNSCLRISSIDTLQRFADRGLQVFVDLSLSGARAGNYERADLFGGRSSVESAVREMLAAGVQVVGRVTWGSDR